MPDVVLQNAVVKGLLDLVSARAVNIIVTESEENIARPRRQATFLFSIMISMFAAAIAGVFGGEWPPGERGRTRDACVRAVRIPISALEPIV